MSSSGAGSARCDGRRGGPRCQPARSRRAPARSDELGTASNRPSGLIGEPRPLLEPRPGGERSIEAVTARKIPDDDVSVPIGRVCGGAVRREHRAPERQIARPGQRRPHGRGRDVPDQEPRVVPDRDDGASVGGEGDPDEPRTGSCTARDARPSRSARRRIGGSGTRSFPWLSIVAVLDQGGDAAVRADGDPLPTRSRSVEPLVRPGLQSKVGPLSRVVTSPPPSGANAIANVESGAADLGELRPIPPRRGDPRTRGLERDRVAGHEELPQVCRRARR